jgi:hypothetical protein
MRRLLALLLLFSVLPVFAEDPVKGRIVKMLPLLLNAQGRDSLSPSLYDRDAYQVYLRAHTNEISAIRFDVLGQVDNAPGMKFKYRLEARGVTGDGKPTEVKLEQEVKPTWFRHWTSLTLGGEEYKKFGTLTAWHATLWADGRQLSEEKSFLW